MSSLQMCPVFPSGQIGVEVSLDVEGDRLASLKLLNAAITACSMVPERSFGTAMLSINVVYRLI